MRTSQNRRAAINLRQLRYFCKVVELGNMTKAASFLNVAQPALGLQIRQLEESLGSPLLTRHSRGVEATPAGRVLFERAQQILRLVDHTRAEMLALAGPMTETVRIGVTPAIMNMIGYDLLVEARQDIPNVFLSATGELGYQMIEALKRNELDFALIFDVEDTPLLSSTPVYDEELLFVTSVEGCPATPLTFAEAIATPLVLPCDRHLVRKLIDFHCEQTGLKLKLSYEVNSPTAIRTFLLREPCSTIVPIGAVADDIRSGRLTTRRISNPALVRRLSLVRPASGRTFQQDAAIVAFLHRMAAKLAEREGIYMRPVPSSGGTSGTNTATGASNHRPALRAAQ